MKSTSYRTRYKLQMAGVYIILAVVLLFTLFPFYWALITSLKTRLEAVEVTPQLIFNPTSENYVALFEYYTPPFTTFVLNSLIVALGSSLLSIALGSLAAYGFARFQFRGRGQLSFWFLTARMMPSIALVIPLYLLYRNLQLFDTQLGVIVAHTTFNLPFVIWMLVRFFYEVPIEIEEAATIDGCGPFHIFFRIALPLAKTGIAAMFILCFIFSWNEFLFALMLTAVNAQTLPVAVMALYQITSINWAQISAGAIFAASIVIVVSFIIQRYIVRGLTLGAVKF